MAMLGLRRLNHGDSPDRDAHCSPSWSTTTADRRGGPAGASGPPRRRAEGPPGTRTPAGAGGRGRPRGRGTGTRAVPRLRPLVTGRRGSGPDGPGLWVQVERIVYRLSRRRYPHCGGTVQAQPPGVLPRCQYGNGLLTHMAVQHYVYGTPLGQLEKQTGIGYGSLVDALHQLARRLKSVPERLLKDYHQAPVRHADETTWRNDGGNGYAWLFATKALSLFRFRPTRSATVAREVLGDKRLAGVLRVGRYAGCNQAPCANQYCYAHLLRDVQDLAKEFPDQPEVAAFVETLAPLLASAMGLRGLGLSCRQFLKQAAALKRRILAVVNRSARHPAVQSLQEVFRRHADRMYHWARDPAITAENNLAERELRPLVVARKVSFGSQSHRGAATRETLMTVLHTLRKRTADPAVAFRTSLNRLAEHRDADPHRLLFVTPPPNAQD